MSDLIFFPALGLVEGKLRPSPAMVYIPILARPLSAKPQLKRPLTALTRLSDHRPPKRAQTAHSSRESTEAKTRFHLYDLPKRSRKATPRQPPEHGIPKELQKFADFCRQRGVGTRDIEQFLGREKKPKRPRSHADKQRPRDSSMDCSSVRALPECSCVLIVMVEERLSAVLLTVLLPQYHSRVDGWLEQATGAERKGVKMMGAIHKHKGLKKFRIVPTSQSAVSLRAAQQLQRRALTTTYETEFAVPNSQRPLTAVLSRTRFSDLPCSQILNGVTIRFIESWLSLHDSDEYVETVLETLRSLLACFNSARRPTTETKRQFVWNDPNKLMKPHRLDHLNSRSLLSRNASSGRPWVIPKPIEVHDVTIKPNTFTAEDLRRRRDALAKGSGQVATWVVGPPDMLSNYQNTYTTHFNKYKGVPAPDFHTSVSVGRMVPNPDSLPG